jgi:hypothetical protein
MIDYGPSSKRRMSNIPYELVILRIIYQVAGNVKWS